MRYSARVIGLPLPAFLLRASAPSYCSSVCKPSAADDLSFFFSLFAFLDSDTVFRSKQGPVKSRPNQAHPEPRDSPVRPLTCMCLCMCVYMPVRFLTSCVYGGGGRGLSAHTTRPVSVDTRGVSLQSATVTCLIHPYVLHDSTPHPPNPPPSTATAPSWSSPLHSHHPRWTSGSAACQTGQHPSAPSAHQKTSAWFWVCVQHFSIVTVC